MDFEVIAIFGPTGVGKTAVAIALARASARRRGAPGGGIRGCAAGLRGPGDPHRRRLGGRARALEHRLVSFLPVQESFSAGRYAELAHAEIDALLAEGRRPIVVGGTGLYLRAALADLDLRPPPLAGRASAGAPSSVAAVRRRCTPSWPAVRREPRGQIDPHDRQRIVRALELLRAAEPRPRRASARSSGPPRCATPHCSSA